MILSDLLDISDLLLTELNNLDMFIKQMYIIKNKQDTKKESAILGIITAQNGSPDYRNDLQSIKNWIIPDLQIINFMDFGIKFFKVKENEYLKFDNNIIVNKFRTIIELIEDCYNEIYSYLNNGSTIDEVNKLMSKIDKLIHNIDEFKMINNNLNEFNTCLEPKYEQTDDKSVFLIRFHKEDIATKEIAMYIETIDSIYERICALFDISTQDYKMQPIKLESGSWLEKLIGHEKVIEFLSDLLNKSISFIYRNYTREGKIKGEENKINLLKQGIELTEFCEKYGIDTKNAKDTLEANLNALCQDIYKLTANNKKITINEKTYDLEKEVSQKMIEEINKLGLKEGSDSIIQSIEKKKFE